MFCPMVQLLTGAINSYVYLTTIRWLRVAKHEQGVGHPHDVTPSSGVLFQDRIGCEETSPVADAIVEGLQIRRPAGGIGEVVPIIGFKRKDLIDGVVGGRGC